MYHAGGTAQIQIMARMSVDGLVNSMNEQGTEDKYTETILHYMRYTRPDPTWDGTITR